MNHSNIKTGNIYKSFNENFIVLGAKIFNDAITFQYILKKVLTAVSVFCVKYKDNDIGKGFDEIIEHGKIVEIDSYFIENNMSYHGTVDLDIYSVIIIKRQMLGEIPANLYPVEDVIEKFNNYCKEYIENVRDYLISLPFGTVFTYNSRSYIYCGMSHHGTMYFMPDTYVISFTVEHVKKNFVNTGQVVFLTAKEKKKTIEQVLEMYEWKI